MNKTALTDSLVHNMKQIRSHLGDSTDLRTRQFRLSTEKVRIAVVYMEGLVLKERITKLINTLNQQEYTYDLEQAGEHPLEYITEWIYKYAIAIGDIVTVTDLEEMSLAILSGYTFIGIDGQAEGIAVDTAGAERRQVSEPTAQSVIRGPQEGFNESISTNIALIRRKIKDPNLWLESKQVGRVTKTSVALMFIKGVVDDNVVSMVRERMKKIDIDGILESNYIEELIKDRSLTPFPTVYNTERPDVVASALLEGRVAILVDGTPFVLIVPALFTQFFQSPEDYYHGSDFGMFRMLRFIGLFISMLAPALYIAITTFHQEMLPTPLLISLAAQREGIPFPAFVEALSMEVTFELLREASIRMPKAVGTAISIVGALVLGQAAVEAGLVSAAMVIVVSITAIAGFIFPSIEMSITTRMLRFCFMALAASFGLFGIIVLLIYLVLHLCHLQSFGVPYMAPFAPFNLTNQEDNLIRVPWWRMMHRPKIFGRANSFRQQSSTNQSKAAVKENKSKIPEEGGS